MSGTAAAVLVRDAAEADLAAIERLYAHYVLHGFASFEETPPDVAELARRRAAVRAASLPYLSAEVEGVVAGFAYAAPYRSRSAYRYTVEDSVYVAEAAQGLGVGRALLTGLVDRCTDLGYRRMVAVIGDSANSASIRLHERLGFALVGTLPAVGYKHGRWIDSVLMQRPLGLGASADPQR